MIRILTCRDEIAAARNALRREGCDTSRGWRRKLFSLRYAIRFRTLPEPVALNKSWDVWTMFDTIRRIVPERSAQLFEMGSYNSEIALSLWSTGYRNIRASDFNPMGRTIRWYGNNIDFRCEDFYEPNLSPGSVDVMTALSVIEHGYDRDRLVETANRLLKPGGIMLLTTDYHETKIAVPEDFRLFGLTYRIFSRTDIEDLIRVANASGLALLGDVQWSESEYPIEFLDRRMTFAFAGFRKVGN